MPPGYPTTENRQLVPVRTRPTAHTKPDQKTRSIKLVRLIKQLLAKEPTPSLFISGQEPFKRQSMNRIEHTIRDLAM